LGGPATLADRDVDNDIRAVRATAIAGLVLISAVIVAFVWEIAHGRSGQPYAPLGAIAGVSYLVALVWFRWRS
jgi:uncharacterized membrane protein